MIRTIVLLVCGLHTLTPVLSLPSVSSVSYTPFTSFAPALEVVKSPVTKLETISLTPAVTSYAPAAAAYAVAGPVTASAAVPYVQRIDSYSSGGSSNVEIRDLLRSLLSEIRSGKGLTTLAVPTASADYSTYTDSYSVPPRNTVRDPNAAVYPDSVSFTKKPEKQVVVVQEKQTTPIIAEVPVKEIVRTVYQPVYIPVQVAQPEIYTQSVPVAVPTKIKTGASAVAISTIHEQPGYTIQQQQQVVPVVQEVQQLAYASPTTTYVEGYKKK